MAPPNGIHPRTICVNDQQLDAMEEQGYLDPDLRGDAEAENEALQQSRV